MNNSAAFLVSKVARARTMAHSKIQWQCHSHSWTLNFRTSITQRTLSAVVCGWFDKTETTIAIQNQNKKQHYKYFRLVGVIVSIFTAYHFATR